MLQKILNEINSMGVMVSYSKAQQCPCFDPRRSEGDANCPVCKGLFYQWESTPSFTVKALITNRDSNRQLTETGAWETGIVSATLPPQIIPADFDKVTIVNDVVAVNNEVLRVGATYSNGNSREVLRFRTVTQVESLQIINNGVIQTLVQGADYTVNGNKIAWVNSPATGTLYSVRYLAVPEFLVFKNQPHLRRNDNVKFPYFVKLQRLDVKGAQ